MSILYAATSTLFFVWISRNILYWVHLWQIKEYRWDRLSVHLRETVQGRSLFFSPLLLFKVVLIGAFILVIQKQLSLSLYHSAITFVFALQFSSVVKEVGRKTIKIPKPTIKVVIISGFSLFILFSLFSLPLLDRFAWILLIDRLLPAVVLVATLIMSFPSGLYYDWKIARAIRLLRKQKKLIVMGITGSYGKSSTKEYLAQLLRTKFSLIATFGTQNTPIGLANTILEKMQDKTAIFVAEMGAYKRGEIAQLAQMVHPTIGVLTGINAQHFSLFGSIENTIDAKYELIESISPNGLCLFNGNNVYTYELWKRALRENRNAVLYRVLTTNSFSEEQFKQEHGIIAYNARISSRSVSFDVVLKKKGKPRIKIESLGAPIGGIHTLENLLPAIYVAYILEMKPFEIKEALSLLVSLVHTMSILRSFLGVILLDNTHNTNPRGIEAAVLLLKQYLRQKKRLCVFVLQPMIELGSRGKEEHRIAGRAIGAVCSYLFLTNKNFYQEIVKGVRDSGGKCKVKIASPQIIASFVKTLTKDDIMYFEGRETASSLVKILKRDPKTDI